MIAIDVETSGIVDHTHSILSIGAVDMSNPTNTFYGECRAFDGAFIDDNALAVNGFTHEQAVDPHKHSEADLAREFFEWSRDVEDKTLGAHNIQFDLGFIEAAAWRANLSFPFTHRTIDLHTLAWFHMLSRDIDPPYGSRGSEISLKTVAQYVGVPEEGNPHNALTGAKLHAECIARIAYNKSILFEYNTYPIPWLT